MQNVEEESADAEGGYGYERFVVLLEVAGTGLAAETESGKDGVSCTFVSLMQSAMVRRVVRTCLHADEAVP